LQPRRGCKEQEQADRNANQNRIAFTAENKMK
jgi:hypothetical protein